MKGFVRKNPFLSLCGLNCGLCPMFWGKYCGGCGNGNQSCRIARCSMEHGNVEYCFDCPEYPCEQYKEFDKYDSFITHQRQKADLETAKRIGILEYNAQQQKKAQILAQFLADYNDGRRKTFFFVAVNLLELPELLEITEQMEKLPEMPLKEKCAYLVRLLQEAARKQNVELKLRKKK